MKKWFWIERFANSPSFRSKKVLFNVLKIMFLYTRFALFFRKIRNRWSNSWHSFTFSFPSTDFLSLPVKKAVMDKIGKKSCEKNFRVEEGEKIFFCGFFHFLDSSVALYESWREFFLPILSEIFFLPPHFALWKERRKSRLCVKIYSVDPTSCRRIRLWSWWRRPTRSRREWTWNGNAEIRLRQSKPC